MFKLIMAVLRRIKCVLSPQKEPGLSAHHNDGQSQSAIDKPSPAYDILVVGGLVLLLVGMVYGSIYGAFFLEGITGKQDEQLRFAVIYAARGEEEEADQSATSTNEINRLVESLGSGHAHISMFGLIALALAANLHKLRLREKWKVAAAITFLTGGVLLPLGVPIQPLLNKTLGKLLAIIGGTAVMAGTSAFLWGAVGYVFHERKKATKRKALSKRDSLR